MPFETQTAGPFPFCFPTLRTDIVLSYPALAISCLVSGPAFPSFFSSLFHFTLAAL